MGLSETAIPPSEALPLTLKLILVLDSVITMSGAKNSCV